MADFERGATGLGVEALVYVEVDVSPAYGLLEAQTVGKDPRLAGIVAWAPLEDGELARTYLDALVSVGPKIKGVRRLIQSEPDPGFPLRLVEGLRLLPSYGLTFDICIKHHQLPTTIAMVRACSETSFVLDHLGKPDIKAGQLDPWRDQIAELAALPNVVGCKVSGLVTEADHQAWTAADLAPYVSHALAVFGLDRVLFGGDWPVVTLAAAYRDWVRTLDALTADLPSDDRRKLWDENARRIYRL